MARRKMNRKGEWKHVPAYYDTGVTHGYSSKAFPSPARQALEQMHRAPKLLHRFGDCLLLKVWAPRAQIWQYACVWKGKTQFAGSPENALRQMRLAFPRPLQVVTEIKAYRIWQLKGEYLSAVTRETRWEGPIQHALTKPELSGADGLYSVCQEERLLQTLRHSYQCHAFGVVSLLGQVVIHQLGYRSETQVVREIHLLIPSSIGFRNLLANRYECEVHDAFSNDDS